MCSSKDEAIQYAAAEIIEARDTPPSAWRSVKMVGAMMGIFALLYGGLIILDVVHGRTDKLGDALGAGGAILLLAPLFGVLDYIGDKRRHKVSKLSVFDWAEEYRK